MFLWLREWREFRKVRGTVRLMFDGKKERRTLADLVSSPGFMSLKAMMMSAALQEIVKHGAKSEQAPGLARAVALIAECEMIRDELRLEERALLEGKTIEDVIAEDEKE